MGAMRLAMSLAAGRIFGSFTPPATPSTPTDLTTASLTDTTVTLNWVAGIGGGTVDEYEIEVQETGGDWSSPVFQSTSLTATKAVTGLTAETEYDARVRATNGAGDSSWLTETALFTTNAAAGTPSYDPPYGSGDRTASLVISTTGSLSYSGTLSRLLNGTYPDTTFFWLVTGSAGDRIVVQFPVPVLITGCKWRQQGSTTHGTWQAAISDDGSTWDDVGAQFTMGGATVQEVTTMAGNTTPCEYWSVELISGQPSNIPYFYQLEFEVVAV